MNDLTLIYYTSNYLEDKNPYFLANTKKQLLKAADGLPIVIVSQKPTMFGDNSINVNMGNIGRSHLNIYRQILEGCKAAKTKYVAMAEDDILYSWEHFHTKVPKEDTFLYDMNRLSIFTWGKIPLYSYRHNRTVVNQLIAPREMLIKNMEERFERWPQFVRERGGDENHLLKYWGDPGRYEDILGVPVRKRDTFMSTRPSIVFSHQFAYGYETNQGSRKRLGDLRIVEVFEWGRAEDMLKYYYEEV